MVDFLIANNRGVEMDRLRKERNRHSKGQNCWWVFDGMVTLAEQQTEAEADALIARKRAEYEKQQEQQG
jgi:hypothetical protein